MTLRILPTLLALLFLSFCLTSLQGCSSYSSVIPSTLSYDADGNAYVDTESHFVLYQNAVACNGSCLSANKAK